MRTFTHHGRTYRYPRKRQKQWVELVDVIIMIFGLSTFAFFIPIFLMM